MSLFLSIPCSNIFNLFSFFHFLPFLPGIHNLLHLNKTCSTSSLVCHLVHNPLLLPIICNVSFNPVWPNLSLEYTTFSRLFDIFIIFPLYFSLIIWSCLALIADSHPFCHNALLTFDLGFNLSFSHWSIHFYLLFFQCFFYYSYLLFH